MKRIEDAFRAAKRNGRAAFIPYITAGDPNLEATSPSTAGVGRILVIHGGRGNERAWLKIQGREIDLERVGADADVTRARSLITANRERCDAIAIEDFPVTLHLGGEQVTHEIGRQLLEAAQGVPVLDGNGVRPPLERLAVDLAERAQPGIFTGKRSMWGLSGNH